MKLDAAWLISVFGLGIAMTALFMLSRARARWEAETARLKGEVESLQRTCQTEVNEMKRVLHSMESGMVSAQEALREGRLNLTARAEALQMLRHGASPEVVAAKVGIARSEAALLTRVGQLLATGRGMTAKH